MLRRIAFASALAMTLGAQPAAAQPAAISRTIDPLRSRAGFSVSHLYVSKVTGTVPISRGIVVLAPDSIVPISVNATLDARRLDTHDDDRNDSLQGPDWFDTKRFPEWTFTSTAIAPGTGGAFTMDGTITIHGVSQPVHLTVTMTGNASRPAYHAQGHLDRHSFGMKTNPLDGTIGDDLTIDIDVTLKGGG